MRIRAFLYSLIIALIIINLCASVSTAYDNYYYQQRKIIEDNPNLTPEQKKIQLDNLERSWLKSEQNKPQNGGETNKRNTGSSSSSDERIWDTNVGQIILISLVVAGMVVFIKLLIDSIRRRKRAREGYQEYTGKDVE